MSITRIPLKYLRPERDLSFPERHVSKPRSIRVLKPSEAETRTSVSVSPAKRVTKDSVANFLFGEGGLMTYRIRRGHREADLLHNLAAFSGR